MSTRKNSSSSNERRFFTYLKPRNFQLIIADAHINMNSVSNKMDQIVSDYYDKIPDSKRQQLLNYFDKLTPEQIHPKRHGKGHLSKHGY